MYNGFTLDPDFKNYKPSAFACELIGRLERFPGFKFITVSSLNEAKGVERIPQYLNKIQDKYGEFLWVIIGNGSQSVKLDTEINKCGIRENVIWINEAVPHNDVLSILSKTDFYILFHRFSIFDFATIEAMAQGNIPILTAVGGNKEVIEKDTGILVSDIHTTSDFERFISTHDIKEAKKKNISLQNERFSEYSFLEGYRDIINEIDSY